MFLLNYIIYMYIFLMFKFIGNYYGKLEHTGLLKAKVFQLRVVPYIPTPKRKDTLTQRKSSCREKDEECRSCQSRQSGGRRYILSSK